MAARITSIVVNCTDPAALAAFWGQVLGWEVREADDDLVTLGPAGDRRPPGAGLHRVPDPTPGRRRLHLDVNATDRDQDAELERLLELGATRWTSGRGRPART